MFMPLIVALSSALAAAEPPVADFVVAPNGNDNNPGTLEEPFATIHRAQAAVRSEIAQGLVNNVTVLIRGGEYLLEESLVFGPADSGNANFIVRYMAYPGETPVISGGRHLTGWKQAGGGKWTLNVADAAGDVWPFRQLFADGQRLPRGRFPNPPDLLRVEKVSPDVTEIALKSAPSVANLAGKDAELVMYQNWSISRVAIVSSQGKVIKLANPMGWIGHGNATTASPNKPAIIENALEFVDQPGEWYLDRKSGVLTYQADEGEDPNAKTFVAPKLERLLVVEGEPGNRVTNLRVEGLTFAYTSWSLPLFGYQGIQAGHHGTTTKERTHVLPVGIEFTYAEDCALERCTVTHFGPSGIGFGQQCRSNRVVGCALSDIGGNGIMVGWRTKGELAGGTSDEDHFLSADWANPEDVPTANEIAHNRIQTCGAINHGCVGIYDGFCADTRIAHNVIYAMPYTGISVGFRWNTSETSQRGTIVEYNHVYDTMRMLADGGCLYTLGYQPGTVIRGNVFHDAHRSAFAHGGAPNNGIFFDQGSKGYHVVGNTIYDCHGGPIRFNQTNAGNMTWENNSFDAGPDYRMEP
jgi:hypothetical protein